jgi:hypothetical protein
VPTSLLLVSRRSVSEELRSDVSRLRDLLTREIVLGPLDLPETRALAAMAETHGWTVEEGIADEVHRLTGGHPYRLQYYLQAALADSGKLTAIAVRAVDTPATIEHLDRLLGPRGAAAPDRAAIFVSYSHKDEAQKEQLMTHLGVLGSAGAAKAWVDDQIGAGEDWRRQILEAIDGAKVAVLLVSASFLNSPFILDVEIPRIRKRRHEGGLQVVPIIASDCAWQNIDWLAEMNVKPKNGSPVWREGGIHADKELTEIVHQIATLLAAGGIR